MTIISLHSFLCVGECFSVLLTTSTFHTSSSSLLCCHLFLSSFFWPRGKKSQRTWFIHRLFVSPTWTWLPETVRRAWSAWSATSFKPFKPFKPRILPILLPSTGWIMGNSPFKRLFRPLSGPLRKCSDLLPGLITYYPQELFSFSIQPRFKLRVLFKKH